MPSCVGIGSNTEPILSLMAVDKIQIPPLEERVKHQRAIISLHSNLP